MTMTATISKKNPVPIWIGRQEDGLNRLSQWMRDGRSSRFVVETLVTPDMARAILENNAENRLINNLAVERYAAAMLRGEWHLNGQNIIIASNGELNDGQHRLHGVIMADIPVAMGLQFGVARESRTTLDVGNKRTLGDHFAMAQLKNATNLAATVRLAWMYDAEVSLIGGLAPSVDQAFRYIENNPTVGDYIRPAHQISVQFKSSLSQFAFAAFVCSRVNKHETEELLARVNDGLGLAGANVPAARIRERLMGHLTNRAPMGRMEAAAIFIKAFNASLGRRRMRALSWAINGPKAEPFPIAGA